MAGHHPTTLVLVLALIATATHQFWGAAACSPEEQQALLDFKKGITADPQGILSTWNASTDCCSPWGNIVCKLNGKVTFDPAGHVDTLDVSPDPAFDDDTIFLEGTISPSLTKLTYLTYLDLSSMKRLTGHLPAGFGNLKNLQHFDVGTNKLTGPIPADFGTLTNLNLLSLGNNLFSGPIPAELGNIGPKLKTLYLGNNQFTGNIPESIYKLTGLEVFYLYSNQLTGGISPSISQFKAHLTNLALDSNKLTGPIPPAIGDLKNLGFCTLNNNGLTGGIPPSIGNLKALYHLWLNDNKLSGPIPPVLAKNLKNLISLDLSNNRLVGPIPQGAPFSTFPASNYAGNPGLCGHPLPACKRKLLR